MEKSEQAIACAWMNLLHYVNDHEWGATLLLVWNTIECFFMLKCILRYDFYICIGTYLLRHIFRSSITPIGTPIGHL